MKQSFNVLEYNFTSRKIDSYDVLPYFRNRWKDKKFNFDKKDVKTKNDLKEWIKRSSQYQFWARCEYEFIMSPWPYNDTSKESIIKDMRKIDVHEQIMMNIDVITDILFNEFELNKTHSLLEEFTQWLDSPECKQQLEFEIESNKRLKEQYNRFNKKLNSLSIEERNEFFTKVKNKYSSKEYQTRWFNRGIEPENFLYDYIYEYGKEFGEEVPDDLTVDFLVDAYIIDNKWKVELFCGQGSFIAFTNIENSI